jgi:hypothetical protein
MVNKQFADHVTSMAFNLSLSKSMIITLGHIATNTHCRGSGLYRAFGVADTYVPCVNRLLERGLVHSPDKELPGRVELTEPGELVVQLLRMAGLLEKFDKKLEAVS